VYTYDVEVVGPFGEQIISSSKGTIVLRAGDAFRAMLDRIDEGGWMMVMMVVKAMVGIQ